MASYDLSKTLQVTMGDKVLPLLTVGYGPYDSIDDGYNDHIEIFGEEANIPLGLKFGVVENDTFTEYIYKSGHTKDDIKKAGEGGNTFIIEIIEGTETLPAISPKGLFSIGNPSILEEVHKAVLNDFNNTLIFFKFNNIYYYVDCIKANYPVNNIVNLNSSTFRYQYISGTEAYWDISVVITGDYSGTINSGLVNPKTIAGIAGEKTLYEDLRKLPHFLETDLIKYTVTLTKESATKYSINMDIDEEQPLIEIYIFGRITHRLIRDYSSLGIIQYSDYSMSLKKEFIRNDWRWVISTSEYTDNPPTTVEIRYLLSKQKLSMNQLDTTAKYNQNNFNSVQEGSDYFFHFVGTPNKLYLYKKNDAKRLRHLAVMSSSGTKYVSKFFGWEIDAEYPHKLTPIAGLPQEDASNIVASFDTHVSGGISINDIDIHRVTELILNISTSYTYSGGIVVLKKDGSIVIVTSQSPHDFGGEAIVLACDPNAPTLLGMLRGYNEVRIPNNYYSKSIFLTTIIRAKDLSGNTTMLGFFNNSSTTLQHFEIEKLPNISLIDWGLDLCLNITVKSLVNVLNALPDNTGNPVNQVKLDTLKDRLSLEQIKIATDKNWEII